MNRAPRPFASGFLLVRDDPEPVDDDIVDHRHSNQQEEKGTGSPLQRSEEGGHQLEEPSKSSDSIDPHRAHQVLEVVSSRPKQAQE